MRRQVSANEGKYLKEILFTTFSTKNGNILDILSDQDKVSQRGPERISLTLSGFPSLSLFLVSVEHGFLFKVAFSVAIT